LSSKVGSVFAINSKGVKRAFNVDSSIVIKEENKIEQEDVADTPNFNKTD